MGAGLLAVKSGFILFIKNYQFPIQINTIEREEGLLLGSRELLCLSSRISRTLVSGYSLSELYFLGESVSCQIQGEYVGW
jgi:hypothetical protein